MATRLPGWPDWEVVPGKPPPLQRTGSPESWATSPARSHLAMRKLIMHRACMGKSTLRARKGDCSRYPSSFCLPLFRSALVVLTLWGQWPANWNLTRSRSIPLHRFLPSRTSLEAKDRTRPDHFNSKHWAYNSLEELVDIYQCVAGFPDGTFKKIRRATRFEMAALVDSCLGSGLSLHVETHPAHLLPTNIP